MIYRPLVTFVGALSLVQIPLSAQETAAPAPAAEFTNADFLDCAVWATYIVGTSTDPKQVESFGFAMSWFIGRYEGAVGRNIDADLSLRSRQLAIADLERLNPKCSAKMLEFGQRLMALGSAMEAGSSAQ